MRQAIVKVDTIYVNLAAASPGLRRTYRAYLGLSPQAKADVNVLVHGIVEAMHRRSVNTHFGPGSALELLGALLEKGIL